MSDALKLKLIADARLLAMEFLIVRLFGHVHDALTDAEFDLLLADYWQELDAASIPGLDAVTSDAMAAEVRDSVQMLLVSAKKLRLNELPASSLLAIFAEAPTMHRGHEITLTKGSNWFASIRNEARMDLPTGSFATLVEGQDQCLSRARDLIDLYLTVGPFLEPKKPA